MNATKVLRRLFTASPFSFLPLAMKIPFVSPASMSPHILKRLGRNRRLEKEMSVVYEVGRIVTSTLDIQHVYDEFASQLRKLVDFDRISLVEVDKSKDTFQIKYAVQEVRLDHLYERVLPLPGTRTQLVIESGQTYIQEDISSSPAYIHDHLHSGAVTDSLIIVPLTGKDGVLGTLNLFSGKPATFGAREKAILEVLANQIAPAVENARLYEESIKSQKAFRRSDARFRRLMMQAADPLFLTDTDGRIVDVNDLACQGLGYTREELLEMRDLDFTLGDSQRGGEANWRSPLADEIVTIETTHRRKNGTTFPVEMRVCLIELDGRQYRSAIARDITERKRAQEDQMRRAREDSVMAEIGRVIGSSLNIAEVYQNLGQEIQTVIPFHRMSLAMVQSDGAVLSPVWVTGIDMPGRRPGDCVSLDGTIGGRVYRTGSPLMLELDDDGEVLREFPGLASSVESGLRSFLSVPLISRGNVIAVLQMRSKEPRAYSQQHLDLAVRVANQISGAIAASRLLEQQKATEECIKASLREKEVLLQEINHRVKNNLQIISSLLNLQSADIHDPMVTEILQATQGRIQAMATIHDKLYQSEDLGRIDFGKYLKSLTDDMRQSYGVNAKQVELIVEVPETLLGVDIAIPCGLIVNELVSNALKHAFPAGRAGMIHVGMSTNEDRHRLTISDDGVGLPGGLDFKHSHNLGLRLVNAWVEQLGGTLELRRDRGVEVTIAFPKR